MADWYYAKNGQRYGPVSGAQLKQLAQSGELRPDDLVFKEGGKEWVAASTVTGLFGGSSTASKVTPSTPREEKGGLEFAEDDSGPRRLARRPGALGDVLMFRRMIAPWALIVIFWIGVAGYTLFGLGFAGLLIVQTRGNIGGILSALGLILAIPVAIFFLRLYVEMMIVIFRINETLTDIKNVLERQPDRG